ncbi:MAG: DUF1993 domain-containing protein [Nannocystaceae bacterium]|nr:DUF1993 domain-containing protein [Nannocystaceae bacterium]
MLLHTASVFQMSKMLRNLDGWLEKAAKYAEARSFDPNNFVGIRLAPDQFSFGRQVQSACDAAKAGAARLAGIEVPSHPDTETTIEELRARVAKTLAFLETITPEKLEGREDAEVVLPFLDGKKIKGADYLFELAQPNFYFHVTTTYTILRDAGVELGKRDYVGSLRLSE